MNKILTLIFLMIFFSCQIPKNKKVQKETGKYSQNYFRHLDYLIQLKKDVALKYWNEFSEKDFFKPSVYYSKKGTFVLNPNAHIREITENEVMKPFNQTARIKLSEKYTDTTSFNFSTSYSDSDSTALYYQDNVLFFQSFELTKKLIGVNDIQDWSIMVIHELFHGYQRSIPEFKAYYSELEIPGGPDNFLARHHKELAWFKESVYEENEILKSIWLEGADVTTNLRKYDSLKLARIEKIKQNFGIDIKEVEDYEIMIEGHARYFESLSKIYLSQNISDNSMLSEQDSIYFTNMFKNYEVKKDKGLYNIYNDRYYYQLGYNLSMILKLHLPEYKESIYIKENNFNSYIDQLKALNNK